MNYTTAVFLINKHARAILATYEEQDAAKRTLFKTLDDTIKVDDFIIVPTDTRHRMTVCKVVEVDADVDFESQAKVDWVIGVVDRAEYDKVLAQEGAAIQAIKAAELRKKREDLRDSMLKNHMDSIKALPIYSNGETQAPEVK